MVLSPAQIEIVSIAWEMRSDYFEPDASAIFLHNLMIDVEDFDYKDIKFRRSSWVKPGEAYLANMNNYWEAFLKSELVSSTGRGVE